MRFYLKFLGFFSPCPFGKELQGVWNLRKQLFLKYNQGIQLDAEGLYSAVPERIANQIAKNFENLNVVDAFCGAGSVSIALAKKATKVTAFEINQERLNTARHNAGVYGVSGNIEFIQGDALDLALKLKADAVFLDPPWGGPQYEKMEKFTLKDFSINLEKLLSSCLLAFKVVALNLPKNFDMGELQKLNREFSVQKGYFLGEVVLKTVYFKNA